MEIGTQHKYGLNVKERTANEAIDDPHIRCLPDNFLRAYGLPHLLKFVHSPVLLVVLNEMNAGYRQVLPTADHCRRIRTHHGRDIRRRRGRAIPS